MKNKLTAFGVLVVTATLAILFAISLIRVRSDANARRIAYTNNAGLTSGSNNVYFGETYSNHIGYNNDRFGQPDTNRIVPGTNTLTLETARQHEHDRPLFFGTNAAFNYPKNPVMGIPKLDSNVYGGYNIAIGVAAGMYWTTNTGSIALGNGADTTNSFELVIKFLDGTELRQRLPTNTVVDLRGFWNWPKL